jgi:hypothetical protein
MEMDFDLDLDELEPMYYGDEAADMDEDGCGNCGKTGVALHHVPEFNFMGCDECMAECMAIIEADRQGKELYPCDRQVLRVLREIAETERVTRILMDTARAMDRAIAAALDAENEREVA